MVTIAASLVKPGEFVEYWGPNPWRVFMGHPFEVMVLGPMAWRTSMGHPFRSKGEDPWVSLRKFGLAILSSTKKW